MLSSGQTQADSRGREAGSTGGGVIAFTDWVEGSARMTDAEAQRFLGMMIFANVENIGGYVLLLSDNACEVRFAATYYKPSQRVSVSWPKWRAPTRLHKPVLSRAVYKSNEVLSHGQVPRALARDATQRQLIDQVTLSQLERNSGTGQPS